MFKEKYLDVSAMHFELWMDLDWSHDLDKKQTVVLDYFVRSKKIRIDVWKTFHSNIAISVVVPVMQLHVYDRVLGESKDWSHQKLKQNGCTSCLEK